MNRGGEERERREIDWCVLVVISYIVCPCVRVRVYGKSRRKKTDGGWVGMEMISYTAHGD